MKTVWVILRRSLRRWLVFLLLLAAPIGAVQLSKTETSPPAGLYMPENDPVSQRIAAHLTANGFIRYEKPDALAELVRTGELDCAAVFPKGLAQRITHGELKRCVIFYQAPASYTPELYQSHVAAALFREYVPYISSEAFADTPVPQEDVVAAYEAMFREGYAFSLEVQLAEEGRIPADWKARSLAMGAAAILQCVVLLALCGGTMEKAFRPLAGRLGLGRCVTAVVLPEVLVNALWAAAFTGLGLCLAGFPELLLPAVIHSVALSGIGLLLATALSGSKGLLLLLPILVVASAALCPVYTDLALLLPAVEPVRYLLPAYWLWLIPEKPVLWAVIALAAMAAGLGSMLLRYALLEKYKWTMGSFGTPSDI